MQHHLINLHVFFKEIKRAFTSPFFVILTIVGNSLIGVTGLLFFLIEEGKNPRVTRYMDAIWWSFATATTTGYGDITPVTDTGKILSILLMLMGLAIFAMYTAFFAEIMITSKTLFISHKKKHD